MGSLYKNFFIVIKTAFNAWWLKDPFKESAVIAYYAIFSLPGLLTVIISIAGYFFGEEAVNGQITNEIKSFMGVSTARQIQEIIIKAALSKNSFLATLIGLITILFGATGVFIQFQKALNGIWKVKAFESKSGIIGMIKERLFSFGLILAIAFILITSFVISAVLAGLGNWLIHYFSDSFLIVDMRCQDSLLNKHCQYLSQLQIVTIYLQTKYLHFQTLPLFWLILQLVA